jgi:hypothetical protein
MCKLGPTGDDVVVIPAIRVDHPAKGAEFSDEEAILKNIAAHLCLITHEIAWYAMGVALQCDKDTSRSWSRQ